MIGQKADVIFQVAGLSGAGVDRGGLRRPNVIGIGVDVDQSKSLPGDVYVRPDQRREEAGRRRQRGDRQDRRQDRRRRHGRLGCLDDPVGVGLSPFQGKYTDLVTPRSRPRSTRPSPA